MARLIKVGEYANHSEKWAADFLKSKLSDDYLILTNVDVYNDSGFRLECDQIIIGVHAVYVVEVKGFTGGIQAGKNLWTFDTGHNPMSSPVTATRTKAIQLRSRMKRRITSSQLHAPWTQHAIFVTGDRGHNVRLAVGNPDDCIAGPDGIVDIITNPDRLVCEVYHGPLTRDQIDLAEREIEQLEQMRRLPIRYGSFTDIEPLGHDHPFTLSRGVLRVGGLERRFLLRVLEKSVGSNREEYEAWLNQLVEEAGVYHELSSVPGVPYVAPLDEDDERVVFAISWPRGKPIEERSDDELSEERRVALLRAVANTLRGVQERGMVHGRLDPEWIFATESGEIQVMNFTASTGGEARFSPPEGSSGQLEPAGDVWSLAQIFGPWFGLSADDGKFRLADEFGDQYEPLAEWFAAAASRNPADRPQIRALTDLLRRIELGMRAPDSAPEVPFDRVEGALLHGSYRLEESLGAGPAGDVWRASHARGNYPLALHFVDVEGISEEWVRSRFEEIAALHHPMMVRALDMRRVPGQDSLYLAADWLDGSPLDRLLEEGEEIAQDQAISWLRDLLIALEYIHSEGVLHRNITPDAVVISQGRPRLVEFSLKPEKDNASGLVEYADPMVSEHGWRRESDLYALAATFLPVLAGITPRTGRGLAVDLERVRSELQESLPDAVRDGVLTVLSADFELAHENYLGLFGLESIKWQPEQLPKEFLEQQGIKNLEQQYIAWYLLREFHGKSGVRARNRMRVAEGVRKLMGHLKSTQAEKEKVRRNINPLIKQGLLESKKRGGPVRPAESFLASWKQYCSANDS